MDFMYKLLGEIIVTASVKAAPSIYVAVWNYFSNWGKQKSSKDLREFLKLIGHQTKHKIGKQIDAWERDHPGTKLDPKRREELITLLVNLARGARIQNSQGVVRSSLVRNKGLLDQLLEEFKPSRTKGEKVTDEHDWVLDEFIGMGAFGEVWKGTNAHFPTPRAFKFFTKGEALPMIRAESHTLSEIHRRLGQHPNIVTYHDVVVNHPIHPYLALEFVGGGSLEEWLVEDQQERRSLDCAELMRGLVDAVATAHEKGISHRDLKPANILLTEGRPPRAKVTDFGLGQVAGLDDRLGSPRSMNAAQVGTAMYFPPEDDPTPTGQDVFSIGVIWYQLLVNRIERPPYDFAEELRQAGVDLHTIRLISRCLARPDSRFSDAVALRDGMIEGPPGSEAIPRGCFDVSHLFREFHASQVG